MPYSKLIPVRSGALEAIARYLGDAGHPNHLEYEVLPLQVIGAANLEEFLRRTQENLERNRNRPGRRGKPKNAAMWYIVRTPDGTDLTSEERALYEAALKDEAGSGAKIMGVLTWHRNKALDCEDLNLLAATFDDIGRLVRDKSRDPILRLRKRMDEVTDQINELRKERGTPAIQTMREAQQINRDLRGGNVDIVEELANLSKPPRKAEDLKPALLLIDCIVTRFNAESDSISIKKPKTKGNCTQMLKAASFSISKLLAQIYDFGSGSGSGIGKRNDHGNHKEDKVPPPESDLLTMLPPPRKKKEKDKKGPSK